MNEPAVKKKILTAITLVLFGITIFTPNASAIDESPIIDSSEEYSDRGYLIISPIWFRLGLLEPGSNYTKQFSAVNIGGKPLTFRLSTEPFWVNGEEYQAIYSEPSNRTKIAEWVTFPNGTEYTLEPQEKVEISVRIKIPSDAIGGGQYGAVMSTIVPTASKNSSGIQPQARIALQLYSTINGDINYKGQLVSQNITGFSFDPILKASSLIENLGNADFEATYRFKIEPFFGGDIAYEDAQTKIILPETKRIFEQSWDGAPALGIFHITHEIDLINEDGEPVTISHSRIAIICPIWLIFIVLLIVALIVISIIMKHKQRKTASRKPSWEQE